MCPYLTYDDDGSGVCSLRGLRLSPFKVGGFCESSCYVECDAYCHSDDSFDSESEYDW